MTGKAIRFAAVGALLLAVTLNARQAESAPGTRAGGGADPERGKYIYQAYCVSCHGPGGGGDGPIARSLQRDLGNLPTDLSAAGFQSARSDAQISTAILSGGEGVHKSDIMPAWEQALTTEQTSDLVAFVRTLASPSPALSEGSLPVFDHLELGRYLYISRCLACHGPRGQGDGPYLEVMAEQNTPLVHPPDLADYEEYLHSRSDSNLAETISQGFDHSGWPVPRRGWWDRPLDDSEMRALIFYLRSLSIRSYRPFGKTDGDV